MNHKSFRSYAVLILLGVLLAGCSTKFERWIIGSDKAAHEELQVKETEYLVKKGDTLYAIAWLHDLNYQKLAQWNGIEPPKYTIYPRQRLTLVATEQAVAAAKAASRKKIVPSKQATKKAVAAPKPSAAKVSWSWPLAKMSTPTPYRKGLQIKGHAGQAVRAAANGVIVYSGFGLKHYEGLIIIKHPGDFFSAYGFVNKIAVRKNTHVKKGQTIAYLPPHTKVRLYFDMRRREIRLNPMKYMPKLS